MQKIEGDNGPVPKGKVIGATFVLDGREYNAFDGGETFNFSEGFSLMVSCKTQQDIDHYWGELTKNGGEEGPCGWCKDRFGLSWQIIPEVLGQMLSDSGSGNSQAAFQAMLKMKKLSIAELEKAYRGSPVA
jgi:predicted 3-demethylubiquinone-9 3-methyltransferase (glyoxalase superfamily)